AEASCEVLASRRCSSGARLATVCAMLMRARNLMGRAEPITVRADASFLEVQHLFVEAQIGGAPVVDAQGNVIGVVSAADLIRVVDQICDEDLDPNEPADEPNLADQLAKLTAADIATPEP